MALQRDEKGRFIKGNKEGHRFKRGEVGNPNGAPKKLITIAREDDFSERDFIAMCKALLMLNMEQLKERATSPTTVAMEVNICTAIREDIKRGRITTIASLAERCWGKPKEKLAVSTNVDKPVINIVSRKGE